MSLTRSTARHSPPVSALVVVISPRNLPRAFTGRPCRRNARRPSAPAQSCTARPRRPNSSGQTCKKARQVFSKCRSYLPLVPSALDFSRRTRRAASRGKGPDCRQGVPKKLEQKSGPVDSLLQRKIRNKQPDEKIGNEQPARLVGKKLKEYRIPPGREQRRHFRQQLVVSCQSARFSCILRLRVRGRQIIGAGGGVKHDALASQHDPHRNQHVI